MTKEELAASLTGREYCDEITAAEETEARAAGLVVVFGASDDLMEFRGSINDEFGCYNGGVALVDANGLIDRAQIDDSDDEAIADFVSRKKKASTIEALWADEGSYSWTYKTDIPHATFEVVVDGEPYCRGIVFALTDLKAVAA